MLDEKIAKRATELLGDLDKSVRLIVFTQEFECTFCRQNVELVEDISGLSGNHELQPKTLSLVGMIDRPVHLQVYVKPTCPYCPKSMILAYISEHIKSDMVEAIEFPHLANKCNVIGVPKTIVNEQRPIEGAVPERIYVERILESLSLQ